MRPLLILLLSSVMAWPATVIFDLRTIEGAGLNDKVTLRQYHGPTANGTYMVTGQSKTYTPSSGIITITNLEAARYEVDQSGLKWFINVPADSSTYYASALSTNISTVSSNPPYVISLAAGTGVSLSPTNGRGVVTISSTGGSDTVGDISAATLPVYSENTNELWLSGFTTVDVTGTNVNISAVNGKFQWDSAGSYTNGGGYGIYLYDGTTPLLTNSTYNNVAAETFLDYGNNFASFAATNWQRSATGVSLWGTNTTQSPIDQAVVLGDVAWSKISGAKTLSGSAILSNTLPAHALTNSAWLAYQKTRWNIDGTNLNRFTWTNTLRKLAAGDIVRVVVDGSGLVEAQYALLNGPYEYLLRTRTANAGTLVAQKYVTTGGYFEAGKDTNWHCAYAVVTNQNTVVTNILSPTTCNVLEVDYIKVPGGGTFVIETNLNGGAWGTAATIDGSAATAEGGVWKITNTVATTQAFRVRKTDATTKPVLVANMAFWDNRITNAVLFGNLANWSSGITLMNDSAAVSVPIWRSLAPDLYLHSCLVDTNAQYYAITNYLNVWRTNSPLADMVICANLPVGTSSTNAADLAAGDEIYKAMAAQLRLGYFDAQRAFGTREECIQRGFISASGVHPEAAGLAAYDEMLTEWLGLDRAPLSDAPTTLPSYAITNMQSTSVSFPAGLDVNNGGFTFGNTNYSGSSLQFGSQMLYPDGTTIATNGALFAKTVTSSNLTLSGSLSMNSAAGGVSVTNGSSYVNIGNGNYNGSGNFEVGSAGRIVTLAKHATYASSFEEYGGVNLYNRFLSTGGSAEYGIWQDSLYFQSASTLSGGIRFYCGDDSTADLVISTNTIVSVTSTLAASNVVATATGSTGRVLDATASTNVWEDINFPVSTLNPPGGVTGPELVANSGRDGDSLAAVFNNTDATLVNPQLPHTWKTGGTVYPHFHIEPQTTTAITNTWRIKYSVADIDGTYPAWTILTNTVVIAGSQQWAHKLMALPTNGIALTGKTGPSTVMKMRLELISGNVDLHVTNWDLHYQWGGSPVPYVAP